MPISTKSKATTSGPSTHGSGFVRTFTKGVYVALALNVALTLFNLVKLRTMHDGSLVLRRSTRTDSGSALLAALKARNGRYAVVKDTVVYDRYARVYSRDIRFPNGRIFSFDVWGRVWRNDSFTVVAIVPFDRHAHTFTLIREYNPAHGRYVYSFPQGVMEPSRHKDTRSAAAAELEEEAHLRCKHWVPLFSGKDGMPQDKFQRESVFTFLCSDSVVVQNPAHVDDEEEIEIVSGVSVDDFRNLAKNGALQSNNVAAGLLALDHLRLTGMIAPEE